MVWLLRFITAHRYLFSYFTTVVVSLYFIQSPISRQQDTARWLGMTLFLPIQLVVDEAAHIQFSTKENKRLRGEQALLQIENSKLLSQLNTQEVKASNRIFQNQFEYDLRPVHVVARDGSSLYRAAIIDAGESQGITVNMPVITHEGLVGKVVKVLGHSSMISLIRNPNELTSVLERSTNSVAILSVHSDGRLYANFLKTSGVAVGDSLFTSGMGGIYPEYLLVGTIKKRLEVKESDLFVVTEVTPAVNYDKLRDAYVLILDSEWNLYGQEVDSLSKELNNDTF